MGHLLGTRREQGVRGRLARDAAAGAAAGRRRGGGPVRHPPLCSLQHGLGLGRDGRLLLRQLRGLWHIVFMRDDCEPLARKSSSKGSNGFGAVLLYKPFRIIE
jgi:hypothetical protein